MNRRKGHFSEDLNFMDEEKIKQQESFKQEQLRLEKEKQNKKPEQEQKIVVNTELVQSYVPVQSFQPQFKSPETKPYIEDYTLIENFKMSKKKLIEKRQVTKSYLKEIEKELTDIKCCPICYDKDIDTSLDCGHTFCYSCAEKLFHCAICNKQIEKLLKIFF